MTDTSDVVNRVDSLMQRRRTFVATRPVPQPVTEDDDLPVLTDIVLPDTVIPEPKTDRSDETQVTLLAAEIAHAFGEQLANDLPNLIEAALQRASNDLRHGISEIMESALRDFLARRKQLDLPLDGTESPLR